MSFKVLYLGPDSHYAFIQDRLAGMQVSFSNSEEETDKLIGESDVILDAYMKVPFNTARFDKANNLKLFITATTGASHVDTARLENMGVPLLTLKGQEHITRNITAAAEHSWALLLGVARQLTVAAQEALNGGWDRNKYPGVMLRGKTIGILGCGRIGEWMARYANAFGMTVLGYDPYKEPDATLFKSVSLDEMLPAADFVSVHVTLNDSTKNLLSAERFAQMKKGAVVINTSRGEIIDETALLKGLQSGQLRGAGLDVVTSEPYIAEDPLVLYAKDNSNLIITPHIGGFSPDALDVVLSFTCDRIRKFQEEGVAV